MTGGRRHMPTATAARDRRAALRETHVERLRAGIVLVAVAGAMWWLHPTHDTSTGRDQVDVTIWFNGLIEGRHLDAMDAFERRFPGYHGIVGSSASRGGSPARTKPPSGSTSPACRGRT